MSKAADQAQLLENQRVSTCFAPEANACWRWDERGRTLTWANGETIAFREEIIEILDRLNGQGWPSFTVIVLLLAACRGGWRAMADKQLLHAKELVGHAAQREAVVMLWFGQALKGLEAVAGLPPASRTTTAAKAALIARVTAAAVPRWSASETVELLATLRSGCVPAVLRERASAWWPTLRQGLHALACGLHGLDESALRLREQTGTEQLPNTMELPASAAAAFTADQVRALLLHLVDDRECGGVARLARDLLAAAQVPRRLDDPDSLPFGGYSDIGNRGTPDRLLVSEFANEDLVFAVRLALNEALYLRREMPPRAPLIQRSLLIDTGVRLWGTARLVAAATAMALAATAGPKVPVTAWCTSDGIHDEEDVLPIDLGSRSGVVALLAALSAGSHPGAALQPWLNLSAGLAVETDHIVITHPRALADRGFRSAWIAAGTPALLAATVDDRGAFRLCTLGQPGDRTLVEAQLDLSALHAPSPVPGTKAGTTAAERVSPFPLRVPHPCRPESCWDLGDIGVVCALSDGRCTWWDTRGQGPRELTADLPGGRPLLIVEGDEELIIVLHGQPANRVTLVRLPLSGSVQSSVSTTVLGDHPVVRAVLWMSGEVVIILPDRVLVYRVDGACVADESIADAQWIGRRFFRRGVQFLALSWNGQRIAFEPLSYIPLNFTTGRKVTLFDRNGLPGPWWTVNGCTIASCGGEPSITIPVPFMEGRVEWKILELSRDGHRLLLKQPLHNRLFAYDLQKSAPMCIPVGALEPAVQACGHFANGMLARLAGVTAHDGHLALITMKGALYVLVEDGEHLALRVQQHAPPTAAQRLSLSWSGSKRCSRWSGEAAGVIAEVDMRGVLHLRSAAAELPELAVVLFLGKTAVWSADGNVCGPARFLGERTSARPAALLNQLRRYAERLA